MSFLEPVRHHRIWVLHRRRIIIIIYLTRYACLADGGIIVPKPNAVIEKTDVGSWDTFADLVNDSIASGRSRVVILCVPE